MAESEGVMSLFIFNLHQALSQCSNFGLYERLRLWDDLNWTHQICWLYSYIIKLMLYLFIHF